MRRRGFTLIEVLMVIAIIGILASIALGSLNSARDSARKATAKAQLRAIRTGVALLEADTGKWPNGCPPGNINATNEILLSTGAAGLVSSPTVGVTEAPNCQWTAEEVANWRGPYIPVGVDPWNNPYYFDPDYATDGTLRRNCPTTGANSVPNKTVVYSAGPNRSAINAYDCDDIVYLLYEGTLVP